MSAVVSTFSVSNTVVEVKGVVIIKDSSALINLAVTTHIPIGGQRVIAMVAGVIGYADNTNLSAKVIGFSKQAYGANSEASLIVSGELNGFYGLSAGESIYLSTNGVITQTVPTTGYIQNLGVAISSTKISIQIQSPINLG